MLLRNGTFLSIMNLGDALCLPDANFTSTLWHFEHQRMVLFEGCVADPLQTIAACLPSSK